MKEDSWLKFDNNKLANIEPVNLYQKENVEHLVNQLIKLQNTYTDCYIKSSYADRSQVMEAMKKVNEALEMSLLTKTTIK